VDLESKSLQKKDIINIYKMNNNQIFFYYSANFPLKIDCFLIRLLEKDNKINQCLLTIEVSYEVYQLIQEKALFNLKLEVKNTNSEYNFIDSLPVIIETTLNPELLPILLEKANNSQEVIEYLTQISSKKNAKLNSTNIEDNQENESLINTESWLCLGVKQVQDDQEVGFKTFWSYVDFANFNTQENWEEQIADGILNFVTDYTENSLAEITEKATKEIVGSIDKFFDSLNNQIFGDSESEVNNNNEDLPIKDESILEEIIDFFELEKWGFIKVKDQGILRLSYQGENGQWTCFALGNEELREFVFYSVFPLIIPENKRMGIAELITKINYGISLGNFELDFDSGTLNYKTSINVQNEYLTYDLIQPLVYKNIAMMEQYLPVILPVIDDNFSPL
jgi:hypothetical protein